MAASVQSTPVYPGPLGGKVNGSDCGYFRKAAGWVANLGRSCRQFVLGARPSQRTQQDSTERLFHLFRAQRKDRAGGPSSGSVTRRTQHYALVDFSNLAKSLACWHRHTFDSARLYSHFGGPRTLDFARSSSVAQEAASGIVQRASEQHYGQRGNGVAG